MDATKRRLRKHSRTLALTAGVAGGLYLAGSYAVERVREMQERATEERRARESLRRRFVQNQEDCTFTLLALLPTLSGQILAELDVERLTHELRLLSRQQPSLAPPQQKVDLGESVVSLASSSVGSSEAGGGAPESSASGGAGEDAPESSASGGAGEDAPESSASGGAGGGQDDDEQPSKGEASADDLKDSSHESWSDEFRKREERAAGAILPKLEESTRSVQSDSSGYMVSAPSEPPSSPEQIRHSELLSAPSAPSSPHAAVSSLPAPPPPPPERTITKTKMQLWNEIKLTAFTRSITTVYTLVLLTLHTRVQLNILGRYSYIRSVRQLEASFQPAPASAASGWWASLLGAFGASGEESEQPRPAGLEDEIDQETEMAFLTFSWWLVNVGWREVKERVALAVDEVFGPVSLKKAIDLTDLETLLAEVRRKVEWDLGGDGIPRRHSFLPHILPTAPALETHLLQASALSPPYPSTIPPGSPLRKLLDETARAASSLDWQGALEAGLSCAFAALGAHLAGKGLLGGPLEGEGEAQGAVGKGKRLAQVLVEVSKWGKDCLTADHGGLARNDIVDSLADLPALGAFSAAVYSAYDGLLSDDLF